MQVTQAQSALTTEPQLILHSFDQQQHHILKYLQLQKSNVVFHVIHNAQ